MNENNRSLARLTSMFVYKIVILIFGCHFCQKFDISFHCSTSVHVVVLFGIQKMNKTKYVQLFTAISSLNYHRV